jgi:hypothetical protein
MNKVILEDESWNVCDSAGFCYRTTASPHSSIIKTYTSAPHPCSSAMMSSCSSDGMIAMKTISFILIILFVIGMIGGFLFTTLTSTAEAEAEAETEVEMKIERQGEMRKRRRNELMDQMEIAYGAAASATSGSNNQPTVIPSATMPNIIEIKKQLNDVPTWTQIPSEEFLFENDNEPPVAHDNLYPDGLHAAAIEEIRNMQKEKNSGLQREMPCIPSEHVPCSESVAWTPKYIGLQSTMIEPSNGSAVPLYHRNPQIWFRNLNDELRERSLRNAEEWDYYKFFNGRQKLAQFISSNVLNQRDQYMRPISSFDESYCFGNPKQQ